MVICFARAGNAGYAAAAVNGSVAQRKIRIGVCGPHQAGADVLRLAEQVGAEIGRRGAILVCGGLGGVMEAAARGAKQAGGLTVGILPTPEADAANAFIDVPIPTGMGEARNVILVRAAQAVIAIAGAYGTLSEIAFALRLGVPVVGLETWQLRGPDGSVPPIIQAKTPVEAVARALEAAAG
jgi:uncharacterized protein (TIGR00725 family)